MKFGILCVLLAATSGSAHASSIITLGEAQARRDAPRAMSIIALGDPANAEKDGTKKHDRRPGSLPVVFRGDTGAPVISQASGKPAKHAPAVTASTPSEKASPPPAPAQIPL